MASQNHVKFTSSLNEVWENLKIIEPEQSLSFKEINTEKPHEWIEAQLENVTQLKAFIKKNFGDKKPDNFIKCAADKNRCFFTDAFHVVMTVLAHFKNKPIPETFTNEIKKDDITQCDLLADRILNHHVVKVTPVATILKSPWPALHALATVVDRMERSKQSGPI
jgi:hypothetical protein